MLSSYPQLPPKISGLNISVGSFLPRIIMSGDDGAELTPTDMVAPGGLAVCVYNPAAVNPMPLPPPGMDYALRLAMLADRDVSLYVISGQTLSKLKSWQKQLGVDTPFLCDAEGAFASEVGAPLKQVNGQYFRTHAAFLLQEDRVLAILLETDLAHHFEELLMALDVVENREPGDYHLPDQPHYHEEE